MACGSLVALRRRLSPGLPLSRSPEEGCVPTVLRLCYYLTNETAAKDSNTSRVAGGRADMRPLVALVPLALRHRLSAGLLLSRTLQTLVVKHTNFRATAT